MQRIFHFIETHNIDFSHLPGSQTQEWQRRDHKVAAESSKAKHVYQQNKHPVVLVLEFRLRGSIGYYFVCHRTQSLFWLEDVDFSQALELVQITPTDSLVGMKMKEQYWYHNELFPHLHELEDKDLYDLEDMLEFAIGGRSPLFIDVLLTGRMYAQTP